MSQTPRFTTLLRSDDDASGLAPLPPGTVVGDYQLREVLGRGGFGITYEAIETSSGKSVAIKEFFPVGCVRAQSATAQEWEIRASSGSFQEAFELARAQFLEGARALQTFRHSTLARVMAHIEAHGTVYLVMERLQGQTLQELVEEFGPIPENTATQIARDVGEALDAMHRLGFLHLDVKPENVMACDCSGSSAGSAHPASTCKRVILFDFDLLQHIESSGGLGTRPLTAHCGTPGYAPLEQYAQQAQLSPATDLYALGATIWHLLSAQIPIAATDRALKEAMSSGKTQSASLRELGASIEENLDEALGWALEMSPLERPQNVNEWLHALENGRPQKSAPVAVLADDSDAAFLMSAPLAPTANSVLANANGGGFNSLVAPRLPVAPILPPLPLVDGWYQIAARESEFDWPHECACCGKVPDAYCTVKAGRARWPVPFCRRCARHVKAARQAVIGTTCGMTGGVLVAFVAWLLSDFWLGPVGVMLHFGAMAYGVLKVQSAEAIMRDNCCDRKMSVQFGGQIETLNGRRYLVRFLNLRYAHEWKKRNAARL